MKKSQAKEVVYWVEYLSAIDDQWKLSMRSPYSSLKEARTCARLFDKARILRVTTTVTKKEIK